MTTVKPGFLGQQYLPHFDQKIAELVKGKDSQNYNFNIIVEGAISPNKVGEISVSKDLSLERQHTIWSSSILFRNHI